MPTWLEESVDGILFSAGEHDLKVERVYESKRLFTYGIFLISTQGQVTRAVDSL